MDIKTAANDMWSLVQNSNLPEDHESYGKNHLRAMLAMLVSGEIIDEKAHRWIGWIQGCVCVGEGGTLKDMKKINKLA
jgi:hypothetical protein